MEWEVPLRYLEGFAKEIEEGRPIQIPVFSRDTLERQLVRAVIVKGAGNEPGVETLWLKNAADWTEPKPIGIKIVEFLKEDLRGYIESPYEARRTRG